MGAHTVATPEQEPADPDGSISGDDDDDDLDGKPEIKKPGEHDVLLGRGGGTNNHSGNVRFRELVKLHKIEYLACKKVDKPKVAVKVVKLWRELDPPGRFLQRKDETKKGPGSVKDESNIWIEVSEKKAREKASQCLREKTDDVLPYISQLRQQQDEMTEQGVSQLHRHMQMDQGNMLYNNANGDVAPQMRRNSLINMPEGPTSVNTNLNRRGSLPMAGTGVPSSNLGHASFHERRTSMPAASHLYNQQQQQQQQLNMNLMARQQLALREAQSAMERNGGMQPHPNMMGMQSMSQQQLLAEHRALMRQKYANFDNQMMPNGLTPLEQMAMQNNLMAQQQNQAMMFNARGGMQVPGVMNQNICQQGMNPNANFNVMMANNNVNNGNLTNLNPGVHINNMMNQQPQQQMQSPRAQQQGMMGGQQLNNQQAIMQTLSPHGLNGQQQQQMNNHMAFQHQLYLQQQQQNIETQISPPPGRDSRDDQSPHPVRDIHVPVGVSDDMEPLPYGEDQDEPDISLGQEAVPDIQKSGPPRFISPNISDSKSKKKFDGRAGGEIQYRINQKKDETGKLPDKLANSSKQSRARNDNPNNDDDDDDDDDEEYANLNPLPVHPGDEQGKDNKEYQKALHTYIKNHQMSKPAVDIDEEGSDEGSAYGGMDASAWIQKALHDSVDLSSRGHDNSASDFNNSKNQLDADDGGYLQDPLLLGRRGLMKDHRENSKKSLMSLGDAGSCMSIALSEMEESMPLRDHRRDAPTRSSFSNRSISSELTDFSELDCL